ncbi:MAG TPA: hypothetical protein VE242_09830 [Chthoniobacterales bacterium]|nr:hypothetical protein [Chthoniobacterales bacterium]
MSIVHPKKFDINSTTRFGFPYGGPHQAVLLSHPLFSRIRSGDADLFPTDGQKGFRHLKQQWWL